MTGAEIVTQTVQTRVGEGTTVGGGTSLGAYVIPVGIRIVYLILLQPDT